MLLHITVTALLQEEPDVVREFEQTRSMQIRLDMAQQAISTKLAPPYDKEMLDLLRQARDCQQMRDRIVHGAWSGSSDDPITDPQAGSVFNWLKPRHSYEWKLNFAKIKDVAVRIDGLSYQWLTACLKDAQPQAHGGITLRGALQLKLRKQGPL